MRNYIGRFRIGFHQSETMAISFLDKYNVSAVAIRHLEKKINSRFVGVSGTFTIPYQNPGKGVDLGFRDMFGSCILRV